MNAMYMNFGNGKTSDPIYSICSHIPNVSDKIDLKDETVFDNPPIRMYVNNIDNKTTFKIKARYYFELLTPKNTKLLKSKINRGKNGENMPLLEVTEVKLVHCNIVNNDYEHNSRALYTFVSNISFGQLSNISTKQNYIFENI